LSNGDLRLVALNDLTKIIRFEANKTKDIYDNNTKMRTTIQNT